MEILAFFAGTLCCYQASWPVWYALCAALIFRPRLVLVCALSAGYAWASWHQHEVIQHAYPSSSAVLSRVMVSGYVAAWPKRHGHGVQFDFIAESIQGTPTRALLSLTCFDHCPVLTLGERWQFNATLKAPRTYANPGAFNRTLSWHAHHRYWSGSVRPGTWRKLSKPAATGYAVYRLRHQLAARMRAADPHTYALLQALILGITDDLDQNVWALLRRTGTTHLMVISGAHIGLVAGLVYKLMQWLWSRSSVLVIWVPSIRVASVVAWCAAGCYALMAGWGIPAQRALVACGVLMLRRFGFGYFSAWQAWRYALMLVVVFEPHACLFAGFYLSFIAAGILIALPARIACSGVKQVLYTQLLCLVGLLPITLFVFSYASINGFFANLLAIPWVSLLIIPLGLLATLLSTVLDMQWLLHGLHYPLALLLWFLQAVDTFASINLTVSIKQLSAVLAICLALSIAFWLPLRHFIPACVVLMLTALFACSARVGFGGAEIAVLDVGQGLAVVVRTAQHVLVYDTGMQFLHGSDMGQMALIPYLRYQGIRDLDAVVISHPDLDHRGGLASLAKTYRINKLLVDNPRVYQHALSCHTYPDWQWDGVWFHFFALPEDLTSKNNRSCVLQIKTLGKSMLLTGDIERPAEEYLVAHYGRALHASVLLIPHHGSKTSSSMVFVSTVAPEYAVVSYGLLNRYRFPHAEAMQVYQQLHIPVLATATHGYIDIKLTNAPIKI